MTKLKKFQRKGVRLIEKHHGRVLQADDMGLGKTIQILAWLKRHPKKRPAIVVCPASVKWVWKDQAAQHVHLRATVLSGRKPARQGLLNIHPIIVINYEILQHWVNYLKKLKPQVVLIDECHYIKSGKAIRTRMVRILCNGVPHVIAIGGTPLTNRPIELYPTLNILYKKKFHNFSAFARRYSKPRRTFWGWDFSRPNHVSELHCKLKKLGMIRRLKEDVLKDLPSKTREVVPLDIERPREYCHAETDFFSWLSKHNRSKARRARKALQFVKMGYLKRLAAELKMKAAMEWIDNFLADSDEKLIVYTYHRKIMKILRKRYKRISVYIDGSVSPKKRKAAIKIFRNNRKKRLFFGQIRAIGTGTDRLQDACSNGVFLELDWTPGIHAQAEDRLHRMGQKHKVFITYLIARGTIEHNLCRIIQQKQKTIREVLDGKKTTRRNDMNIYDQVVQAMRRSRR